MYPTTTLRMQTLIGPQMVMACQLLRASSEEVEGMVLRELAENPSIELVDGMSAHPRQAGGNLPGGWETATDNAIENQVERKTSIELLEAEAALRVGAADREVLVIILHLLDGHGYLREPLDRICALTGAARDQVRRAIGVLHQLEPPGVGARDLQECLLIQCAHLQEEGLDCDLPRRMIERAWEDLSRQQWGRVARAVGASAEQVEVARLFIARNLYPYPLRLLPGAPDPGDALALPDLVIHRRPAGASSPFRLEIPGEEAFRLRLSRTFDVRLCEKQALTREEQEWVGAQLERARVFIASLEQRWTTLRKIGEFAIAAQVDFIDRGPRWLRPLTRAMVAEALGLHESTVSRAVSDKTVMLPDKRLIPLSDLFDPSLAAKEALRQLLAAAEAPLSDREIAERLKGEGLEVARRTIGKYRQQLRIPNRHLRQAA